MPFSAPEKVDACSAKRLQVLLHCICMLPDIPRSDLICRSWFVNFLQIYKYIDFYMYFCEFFIHSTKEFHSLCPGGHHCQKASLHKPAPRRSPAFCRQAYPWPWEKRWAVWSSPDAAEWLFTNRRSRRYPHHHIQNYHLGGKWRYCLQCWKSICKGLYLIPGCTKKYDRGPYLYVLHHPQPSIWPFPGSC